MATNNRNKTNIYAYIHIYIGWIHFYVTGVATHRATLLIY